MPNFLLHNLQFFVTKRPYDFNSNSKDQCSVSVGYLFYFIHQKFLTTLYPDKTSHALSHYVSSNISDEEFVWLLTADDCKK